MLLFLLPAFMPCLLVGLCIDPDAKSIGNNVWAVMCAVSLVFWVAALVHYLRTKDYKLLVVIVSGLFVWTVVSGVIIFYLGTSLAHVSPTTWIEIISAVFVITLFPCVLVGKILKRQNHQN